MRCGKLRYIAVVLTAGLILSSILTTGVMADEGGTQGVTSSTNVFRMVPPVTSSIAVDPFESDDTAAEAQVIEVNGEVQFHLFGTAGDADWVRFHARAGERYLIATDGLQGETDTILELYTAGENPILLVKNDDFAGGRAARLIWQAPEDGDYLLCVTDKHDRYGIDTGYWLYVRSGEQASQDNAVKAAVPAPPRMRKW